MSLHELILLLIAGCCGAALLSGSLVYGAATVCRWMKWAPVNTTVNVNNHYYGEASGLSDDRTVADASDAGSVNQ